MIKEVNVMNDILDIEKMRYTVRSYSDKELEQEKLAKITKAYNLLCKHVIHTVRPIVRFGLTKEL